MKKLDNGRYECTEPNCKCHEEDYCLAEQRNENQARIESKNNLNGNVKGGKF